MGNVSATLHMAVPPCTWLCCPAHGWAALHMAGLVMPTGLSMHSFSEFYRVGEREGGNMSEWESEWECRWRVVGWEGGVRRVRVGGKCWGLACFADHPGHLSNVHMSVSPFLLCSTRSPLTALVLPASPPLQMAPYLTRCRPCAWRSRP